MTTQNILPFHKLGELVEITTGFAFKSEMFTENEDHIPLVKGENLQQEYIDWENAKRWPINEVNNLEKYFLDLNDIVIAMDRPWVTAGLKWTYIKPRDPRCLLVQRVARLRARKKLNQIYLRYIIGSQYFSQYIQPIVTGINIPHISATQIANFQIPLPPLPIQRKIAAILSAYDELIENNNRRIAILEKMVEEIYREWFVRLRFPGHEIVKIVKGVPEGWEVKKVMNIVDRKPFGKIYRESDLSEEGKVIVIDQSTKDSLGYYDGEPEFSANIDDPMIIFGDHSCKMLLMVKPFSLAENVIPFKSKPNIQIVFLFYLIHNLIETTEYKRHWTELTNKNILVPLPHLQKGYSDCIKPLLLEKDKLLSINKSLKKSRDLLLPRLISGKLNVENLDIAFPPGMKEEQEKMHA